LVIKEVDRLIATGAVANPNSNVGSDNGARSSALISSSPFISANETDSTLKNKNESTSMETTHTPSAGGDLESDAAERKF
jgi:hypothetical protein